MWVAWYYASEFEEVANLQNPALFPEILPRPLYITSYTYGPCLLAHKFRSRIFAASSASCLTLTTTLASLRLLACKTGQRENE
jgi:hypothetical protein